MESFMEIVKNFEFKKYETPWTKYYHPFIGNFAYLIIVFGLKHAMKNQEPWKLKTFSRIHNAILALWSAAMLIGTALPVVTLGSRHGFMFLIEDPEKELWHQIQFWAYIYYLSKFYEVIDTVILVLKKKSLIFLHVWHHFIMMFMPLTWLNTAWSLQWYGIVFNTLIHTFMYSYYFVSTFGYRPWWAIYLTRAQILQFFTVFILIFVWFGRCIDWAAVGGVTKWDDVVAVFISKNSPACSGSPWAISFSQCINISFLILFVNFFIHRYRGSGSTKQGKVQKKD